HVEPCDGDVCGLPNLKCQTPQLEQIRGRGEREIEIDAPVQVGHDLAVERPDTIERSRDTEIDRALSHPAVYDTLAGPPLTVTVHLIGETCRDTFVLKSGRTLQSPAIISRYKTTGVVTGHIQAAPENRVCSHAMSSTGPPPLGRRRSGMW